MVKGFGEEADWGLLVAVGWGSRMLVAGGFGEEAGWGLLEAVGWGSLEAVGWGLWVAVGWGSPVVERESSRLSS